MVSNDPTSQSVMVKVSDRPIAQENTNSVKRYILPSRTSYIFLGEKEPRAIPSPTMLKTRAIEKAAGLFTTGHINCSGYPLSCCPGAPFLNHNQPKAHHKGPKLVAYNG